PCGECPLRSPVPGDPPGDCSRRAGPPVRNRSACRGAARRPERARRRRTGAAARRRRESSGAGGSRPAGSAPWVVPWLGEKRCGRGAPGARPGSDDRIARLQTAGVPRLAVESRRMRGAWQVAPRAPARGARAWSVNAETDPAAPAALEARRCAETGPAVADEPRLTRSGEPSAPGGVLSGAGRRRPLRGARYRLAAPKVPTRVYTWPRPRSIRTVVWPDIEFPTSRPRLRQSGVSRSKKT